MDDSSRRWRQCAAAGRLDPRWHAVLALALLAGWMAGSLRGAGPSESTSSREERERAIRAIPFDQLKTDVQRKLLDVMDNPSIYRRLPIQAIECDPDMYVFLVRHPEIVVNMWQMMGVTNVKLKRAAPYSLDADDGAGTISKMELVYGTPTLHVLYGDGYYEGPLLKNRINGRCILLLSSGNAPGESGRNVVTSRLDVFVRIDNIGADLVAKTLQPLVGRTADVNFAESNRFLGEISRAAETKWPGFQSLVPKLTAVDEDVRANFLQAGAQVHHRALTRDERSPRVMASQTPNSGSATPEKRVMRP